MRHVTAWAVYVALVVLGCDQSLRLVLVESGGDGLTLGGGGSGGSSAGKASSDTGGERASAAGNSSAASGGIEPPLAGGAGASDGGATGDDGGAGGAPEVPPWRAPALYLASYRSFAEPTLYMRHIGDEGFISAVDESSETQKAEASFEIIPGLYDPECITFRAVDETDIVLRHSNSRLYMHVAEDVGLFLIDATFCPEAGLADAAGVSFRSLNYPQRMIHVRDQDELWIDDIVDTPEFAAESTFYLEPALISPP